MNNIMVSQEYYEDWLSDNIKELRVTFCEEHAKEFDKFVKECFDNSRER